MEGSSGRAGASEKCWECCRRLRKMLGMLGAAAGQPNNHSAAALHLVPRGRPQASIVLSA